MATILPYVIGFVVGAACVGLWWFWIGHKAKVRALAALTQQTAQKAQGKG